MTVHGILLPASWLHTTWFAVWAAFVAINTAIYVTLALGKMLPKLYLRDWVSGRNRRTETRSIHPDTLP